MPTRRPTKTDSGRRPAPSSPVSGKAGARAVASGPPDSQEQARVFDQAIALFQQGDFRQAREQFERAAGGPRREMALAATLRARMCERRLAQAAPRPQSAEEHYAYAVALINERRWKEAEEHLNKALAQNPEADHVYYSLALCRGRCGDMEGAYSSLKRAIELQPRNLVAARNDPDFARLSLEPPLSELLRFER